MTRPDRSRALPTALLGVGLAIILAACSVAAAPTPAPPATPVAQAPVGPGAAVSIAGSAFSPADFHVVEGTTVTWTNMDGEAHTVTGTNFSADSKAISSGATFTQTFSTIGTFVYICTIHAGMSGTIRVDAAPAY